MSDVSSEGRRKAAYLLVRGTLLGIVAEPGHVDRCMRTRGRVIVVKNGFSHPPLYTATPLLPTIEMARSELLMDPSCCATPREFTAHVPVLLQVSPTCPMLEGRSMAITEIRLRFLETGLG